MKLRCGGAIDDINLIGDYQADIGNPKQRDDCQRQTENPNTKNAIIKLSNNPDWKAGESAALSEKITA
ncbi:hypothetical protein [Neisseria weaveri]|uniref:hypothetical protein n=1 Tax=Neisseria weaveri TaxID=28091 RepID=UPI0002230AB2|nr:hypothetical protein [Neisseria weaveri]EGV36052.1 hypothetical protein l13_10760 [Neisseria weaveri ATCC 51223]